MTSKQPWAETAEDGGDVVSSAALFRTHAQAVFAVCLAHARNHHDAEDIMQAVFAKAISKVSALREPERARAWLLQIARRECVDFHRRQRPVEPLVEEPPARPDVDPAGQRLREAIGKLPANYRDVIVLYYLDGRDCGGVATSLGLSEPAVRQRLVRARAMLHDLLREDQP